MKRLYFRLLLACALICCFSVSCKKEMETQQPLTEPGIVLTSLSGVIELPSGSPRDVNKLTIMTSVAKGTIAAGRYQVSTLKDEFTTQIATDASGEPVLMGYSYPGQTDFTINAQSTVLAMLMNCAAVYALSPAGKKNTISKIVTSPAFAAATQEVERLLRTPNIALFDTTNAVLSSRVGALFTAASRRGTATLGPAVLINQGGREVAFTNAGVPFWNVIGVYKDGQKLQQMVVDGQNFLPNSLVDLFAIVISPPSPVPVNYHLVGDGRFDIRVRSGRPSLNALGTEQVSAMTINIAQGALLVLSGLMPEIKPNSECGRALLETALNQAFNFRSIANITSTTEALVVVAKIVDGFLGNAVTISKGCYTATSPEFLFARAAQHWFRFVDTTIKLFGIPLNLSFLNATWAKYPAAQDTSFYVTTNPNGSTTVVPTSNVLVHLTQVSGNAQTGTANAALPQPVRVRAIDGKGNPKSGATVAFNATAGNGTITPTSVITDANGYAQASWTLGAATIPTQHVSATLQSAPGVPFDLTPSTFSASTTNFCGSSPILQFDSLKVVYGPIRQFSAIVKGKDATITPFIKGGTPPYTIYWMAASFVSTTRLCGNLAITGPSTTLSCTDILNHTYQVSALGICEDAQRNVTFTISDALGLSQTKTITLVY